MSATDRYSHQLLYATVRQRLLDDIAQGVYQAGQQIPTENELCTQYNVSRITIRKAISDLVADGVLIRWQGKGTFVQSQKVENALLTVSGFTDFGVSQGKATKEKVIEQERVSAAPFCEKLNIPGNSEVFHLCRVMYLDKEPLFIDSSWIRCRVILTLMRFTSKEAPPISYFRSVLTREWSATKRPSISLPPPARRQNG